MDSQVHEQFFSQQLVNEVQVYLAPIIIGHQTTKQTLAVTETSSLGCDLKIKAITENTSYV